VDIDLWSLVFWRSTRYREVVLTSTRYREVVLTFLGVTFAATSLIGNRQLAIGND
jgi:hypothetical protein